jgi:hypothetical protein
MSAPRRTALVAVLAVLGIAIAAAITWGTSQLVRQRIGLASEPLTAGRWLLPPVTSTPAQRKPAPVTRTSTAAPATGTPPRTQPVPTPSTAGPSPPATTTAAPSSEPPPRATSTAAPSSTRSARPLEEAPVEPRPTVRGSQDAGGERASHRDD